MPKITADFSTINENASFDALPAGEYRGVLAKPVHGTTKKSGLPQVQFEIDVLEPAEFAGRKLFDFVTLQTNKGQPNAIGLGRVKAYAIAALGEDAANNPDGIDTDDLEGANVSLDVGIRSYDSENADGTKTSKTTNEIKKVWAA